MIPNSIYSRKIVTFFSVKSFASADLNLAYPKMIDVALPANMVGGFQDAPNL